MDAASINMNIGNLIEALLLLAFTGIGALIIMTLNDIKNALKGIIAKMDDHTKDDETQFRSLQKDITNNRLDIARLETRIPK